MKIVEVKHPLVKHKLGLMREQDISTKRFRELASEVGSLLTYEATADLETEKVTIEGWNGPVEIDQIKGKKITVAGGGGAATAIQVQCALDGVREISIFNIKDAFFERTLQTAEKIRKAVPECVVNVYDIADTAKMTEEIQSSDIFANATIVGMKPMDDQSVVKDLSAFRFTVPLCCKFIIF